MWMIFLPEVDAVLKAALSPDEWERMRDEDWEREIKVQQEALQDIG
ncbi:hypothetical protein [Borborobacter arsenicus]|nr:hypothetical protein [Pseudaminobacter arsenicus]